MLVLVLVLVPVLVLVLVPGLVPVLGLVPEQGRELVPLQGLEQGRELEREPQEPVPVLVQEQGLEQGREQVPGLRQDLALRRSKLRKPLPNTEQSPMFYDQCLRYAFWIS